MPEGAIMLHFVSARGVCGTHLAIIESIIEKPTVRKPYFDHTFRFNLSVKFYRRIRTSHLMNEIVLALPCYGY